MKLDVCGRYLEVPVRYDGKPQRFSISAKDKSPYWFETAYDAKNADAVYYADLRAYLGLTVEFDAPEDFAPNFTDTVPPLPEEQTRLRPTVHFTAERGWINDPNGFCLYDGTYHLFYQHNPFGRAWGNMHWGHAVSRDLMHWEHREEALFQDEYGMMFSGSAVVDRENVSGLKNGADDPILFFYTCAGKEHSTQWLAYSTDGGATLQKYGELIPERVGGNRDPKVIYDAARSRYLMALYFLESTYAIYTSKDLLHWSLLQELELPGDAECPDLYPLTADDGRTLWIYSGASDVYLVGEFDENGLYRPVQPASQLSYRSAAYAAQTLYYEPGKPVIRIAWNRSDVPGAPFTGAMCTPTEMTLKKRGDTYFLCAFPVRMLEDCIEKETECYDLITAKHSVALGSNACRIDLSGVHGDFTCSLFGLTLSVDASGVTVGEAHLPAAPGEDRNITLITDTVSTEVYLNGTALTVVPHIEDAEKSTLVLEADRPFHIESLRVAELAL